MASNVEHRGTTWGDPPTGPKTPADNLDLDKIEAERATKARRVLAEGSGSAGSNEITRSEGTEEKRNG